MTIAYCPLCGWGPFDEPCNSYLDLAWGICSCCGCEYGYDDNLAHYETWLADGCNWFDPASRPETWTLEGQIAHQIRPWPPYRVG